MVDFNVRLEEERLCCPVIMGVRLDDRKELVAIADGYRESTESWTALLRDPHRRGIRAPVLAVGDSPLGSWAALRDVFPEKKEQRCWVHEVANILDALAKSIQSLTKRVLTETGEVKAREHAIEAAKAFDAELRANWPKVASTPGVEGSGDRFLREATTLHEGDLHPMTARVSLTERIRAEIDELFVDFTEPSNTRRWPGTSSSAAGAWLMPEGLANTTRRLLERAPR